MPLQSRFLSQLDVHSEKLLKLFKNRGGQIGRRLGAIIAPMGEDDDVDLCVYLNEDPENLLSMWQQMNPSRNPLRKPLWVYMSGNTDVRVKPEDIGIVLESQVVMQDLDNVPLAAVWPNIFFELKLLLH
ncbi:uncharacterized protein LOC125905467 [Scomber scombrus]|uniref:Uncharacterized protein LOC125905467 n=1 Tax=Scomber scombrus TaxID=13677 RepID=A0AAV1QJ68_SCOSC